MIYLLLVVLANVWLFVCFRLFPQFRIHTFQAITINYVSCVVLGLLLTPATHLQNAWQSIQNWYFVAFPLGLAFVSTFYFTSQVTQKIGLSVTTLAVRISLVVPVCFSLFVFKVGKPFDFWNYLGLFVAMLAILMSIYRTDKQETNQLSSQQKIFLPIGVFLCSAFIDTMLNYSNFYIKTTADNYLFPVCVFGGAASVGVLVLIFTFFKHKKGISLRSFLGGLALGIPNYFTVYLLFKALAAFDNNGAFLFPIQNILIIIISLFIGVLFFKERLLPINRLGVVLAILAIFLVAYQEIIVYF